MTSARAGTADTSESTNSSTKVPTVPPPPQGFTSPPPAGPGLATLFEYAGSDGADDEELAWATSASLADSHPAVTLNGEPFDLDIVECERGYDGAPASVRAATVTDTRIPVVVTLHLNDPDNPYLDVMTGADSALVDTSGGRYPSFTSVDTDGLSAADDSVILDNVVAIRGPFSLRDGTLVMDYAYQFGVWLDQLAKITGDPAPDLNGPGEEIGQFMSRAVNALGGETEYLARYADFQSTLVHYGYALRLDGEMTCPPG